MEAQMAGLSLLDDEGDEITFAPDILNVAEEVAELCLVGTFLTEKQINLNIMKQRLSAIWRPGKGVTIREIGFKRFMFQFYHTVDMQRILEGGPWTFDNNFLLLHHLKQEEQPLQVPLIYLNFWIQIHDLPLGYMSEAVGRQLGSFMGNFLEYDSNNNKGSWRPYMRIRVAIDVRNPLKRCKKIRKSNGESFLASFKYEKLRSFCFLCGCLGHIEKFCDKLFTMTNDDGNCHWGPWLRAQDRRMISLGENKWLREDEPIGISDVPGGIATGGNRADATNQELKEASHGISGKGKETAENHSTSINEPNQWSLILGNSLFGSTSQANHDGEVDENEVEVLNNIKRSRINHTTEAQPKSSNTIVEKKAHSQTTENEIPNQHFLLAGPGFQACQEP